MPRSARFPQVDRGWTGPRPPVSVVVLTLNEKTNIRDCLDSCSWSDDVHVVDSGSEDGTADLARACGARVWTHPFESFGKQRNWAIDHVGARHDWVFHLDADERFTPELVREIDRVLRAAPREACFLVPNRLIFMGRWLRYSAGYPAFQVRLFHKERSRFMDYGHGQREDTSGRVGRIDVPYLHYSFSKGLFDWFDKHNRYSSLEAIEFFRQGARRPGLADLLARDVTQRRRAWKRISYGVPFWPTVRRLATLFVLGGVLEGRAGFTYARLLATYEQMIQMKLRLLRAAARSGHPDFEVDTAPRVSTTVSDPAEGGPAEGPPADVPAPAEAHEAAEVGADQIVPEASPWTFREKLIRAIWMLAGAPVFRLSFHNWYGFRRRWLGLFGARLGPGVRLRPTVHVEIPWNLRLGDGVIVGDHAILYALGPITIGDRAVVSQYAHLCAGTHDYTDRRFPLIRDPIVIGRGAWIGTDAFVGPNVRVGDLAILGARSSAYKDLKPGWIYGGNPAKPIKPRALRTGDPDPASPPREEPPRVARTA